MEFWSKGLGRRSLVLDLGRETVETDRERVALAGSVTAPVTWNYIMYLDPSDWSDLFEVALRREMASYLLCGRRLGALAKLTLFLFRFLAHYVAALVRVRMGRAPEPAGLSVAPDPGARAEIDPAALREMAGAAPLSMRRPRPRGGPRVSGASDAEKGADPPRGPD